jgi:hypothetical protein
VTGLEPANGGITTHCLNHLATPAILILTIILSIITIIRLGYLLKFLNFMSQIKYFSLNGQFYYTTQSYNLY